MIRNPGETALYFASLCAVFAAAVTALSSCEQDQTILTEYEGVNLIANKGFDSPDWAPDQGSTYMLYEEATAFAPPADAAASAVYRLEVKNLVTDGEFETNLAAPGVLPAEWSINLDDPGSTSIAELRYLDGSNGNRLFFDITNPADSLEFSIDTLLDGYQVNSNYILWFDFQGTSEKTHDFYFPTTGDQHAAQVTDVDVVYNFPGDFEFTTSEFTYTDPADSLYITGTTQSGYIDDFRVIRLDVPLRLRITLPWADAERPGGLALVSGWYEFSVYVKSDPAAAGTPNSFASGDVTIGVENSSAVFPEIDTSVSLSDWTRVSTVAFVQINAPADRAEHVLELSVSPTDLKYANSRDSGSLLITAPSLELHASDPTT